MIDLILDRVVLGPECWIWTGAHRPDGYGLASIKGRLVRAHRLVYETVVGPIPVGLVLDHLCRVRNCVNPDHLEPVTRGVNVQRSDLVGRWSVGDICKRGHSDWVPHSSNPKHRVCRICRNARARGEL